ncbi:hypothetical protein SEA_GUYFAGIERI_88 [Rhodococcus phage GuyFagieri]|nr:hypothetical protein SEA_GUYFAGIERI_88 [Rhodococcus phage GuyFagieri]
MSAPTLRRPVPLPAALATVWGEYVGASVAAGITGAELWRVERVGDGSVWVVIDDGDRSGDRLTAPARRGRRRPLAARTRLAGDVGEATALLAQQTAALREL